MKKLTAFLLSILLLLSLTACGDTQTSSESGGKVFVVYFSASGNTERVADGLPGLKAAKVWSEGHRLPRINETARRT